MKAHLLFILTISFPAKATGPTLEFEFLLNGWGGATPLVRTPSKWYRGDERLNFTPTTAPKYRWSLSHEETTCLVTPEFEVICPKKTLGRIPEDTVEFERYALRTKAGKIQALRTERLSGVLKTRYVEVDVSEVDGEIKKLAGSESHVCALTSTGKIYCWGENQGGRLGIGGNPFAQLPGDDGEWSVVAATPAIGFPTQAVETPLRVKFTDVVTRARTTCALSEEKENNVYCWGRLIALGNANADLEKISRTTSATPRRIPLDGVSGKRLEGVAVEISLGVGWASDNSIYVWGGDGSGIVHNETTLNLEPRFIDRLPASLKILKLIPLQENLCAIVSNEAKEQELHCTQGGKHLERRLFREP